MKLIRKIHFWLGTFFAPSIIFFALSGAFQIVGLHEGDGAIGWVARMAQVHKSQTIDTPRARPPRPAAPAAEAPHVDAPPAGPRPRRMRRTSINRPPVRARRAPRKPRSPPDL